MKGRVFSLNLMRIKNKELRQRRHRKEQVIKEAIRVAKAGGPKSSPTKSAAKAEPKAAAAKAPKADAPKKAPAKKAPKAAAASSESAE